MKLSTLETRHGFKNLLIETGTRCNFQCPGCYMIGRTEGPAQLFPLGMLHKLVAAVQPSSVTFLGGEPLLWPHLREAIEYCRERRIETCIASNLALLSDELASYLLRHDVLVIGKLNIGNPEDAAQLDLQAELLGIHLEGARRMIAGIHRLLDAGYRAPRFNLANLIRRQNIGYVGEFLDFCARIDVRPFLELSCTEDDLTQQEIHAIAAQVSARVEKELTPPHFLSSCWHFDNSLYVRANGDLQACSGNPVVLANFLREPNAIQRAQQHPILQARRNIVDRIESPCRNCALLSGCKGGCRAYAERTSLLSAYSKCWLAGTR